MSTTAKTATASDTTKGQTENATVNASESSGLTTTSEQYIEIIIIEEETVEEEPIWPLLFKK